MKLKLKKKQTPPRFQPGAMASRHSPYAMNHANIVYQRLNLQYIKSYHDSKYEPSVFSAIFRHKQPQNIDLKLLVLLK